MSVAEHFVCKFSLTAESILVVLSARLLDLASLPAGLVDPLSNLLFV